MGRNLGRVEIRPGGLHAILAEDFYITLGHFQASFALVTALGATFQFKTGQSTKRWPPREARTRLHGLHESATAYIWAWQRGHSCGHGNLTRLPSSRVPREDGGLLQLPRKRTKAGRRGRAASVQTVFTCSSRAQTLVPGSEFGDVRSTSPRTTVTLRRRSATSGLAGCRGAERVPRNAWARSAPLQINSVRPAVWGGGHPPGDQWRSSMGDSMKAHAERPAPGGQQPTTGAHVHTVHTAHQERKAKRLLLSLLYAWWQGINGRV
jgi:hypothetical protein